MKKVFIKFHLYLILIFLISFLIRAFYPIDLENSGARELFLYAHQCMFLSIGIFGFLITKFSPGLMAVLVLVSQLLAAYFTNNFFVNFPGMDESFRYPAGAIYSAVFALNALFGAYMGMAARSIYNRIK